MSPLKIGLPRKGPHMKLFAIRIENGTTILITGANREEALKDAGLTADVFEQLKQEGRRCDRAGLVETGLGPQRYELVELDEFLMTLELDEDGELQIADFGLETFQRLDGLYPILGRVSKKWTPVDAWDNPIEYKREVREAASQERTSLGLLGLEH